jgi:hypothetical protein
MIRCNGQEIASFPDHKEEDDNFKEERVSKISRDAIPVRRWETLVRFIEEGRRL